MDKEWYDLSDSEEEEDFWVRESPKPVHPTRSAPTNPVPVQYHLVMVYGCSPQVNNAKLRAIFQPFKGTKCKLVYKNGSSAGYGTVSFASKEDANNAIAQISGSVICGGTLTCQYATPQEAQTANKKRKNRGASTPASTPSSSDVVGKIINSNNTTQLTEELEKRSCPESVPIHKQELLGSNFCVIDFESACGVKGGHYFPVEIGVAVFKIDGGVKSTFHRFIDPGPLPAGVASQAAWTTKQVHGIPYHSFDRATNNYHQLWADFVEFVSESGCKTIYAKGMAVEQYCIEWMAQKAGVVNPFHVREMEEIVNVLHAVGNPTESPPPTITNYFWRFTQSWKGKCDYHSELEGNVDYHCALGDVHGIVDVVCGVAELVGLVTPKQQPWKWDTQPPSSGWVTSSNSWDMTPTDGVYWN